MNLVDVRHPSTAGLVIDEMWRAPVVIQLPPVYALFAPPTSEGVGWLNGTKQRLAGKNYGTAIGSIDRFWACVDRSTLPAGVDAALFSGLVDAFVRCRFAPVATNTSAIRAGTHQGLILDDPWRSLFRTLEDAFEPEPELFGGHPYTGTLCTSFNRSGHPDGSIVDRDVALAFARERGIGLFVTCEDRASSLGSYPIFAFGPGGVTIERRGPRLDELVALLPPSLRPALAA